MRSVGRIPNSFVAESTCKWVDMRGRRVSPPPGVDSNGSFLSSGGIDKSDLRLLGDDDERKVCQKLLLIKVSYNIIISVRLTLLFSPCAGVSEPCCY